MALSALLSYRPENIAEATEAEVAEQTNAGDKDESQDDDSDLFPMDDDYVSMGHLYPYGQKLHRASRVDRSIVRDCILYVTVEPCVMCAGLLRQLGIKKVYFGAVNDKFGGTGGVFSIHKNSTDVHRHASSSLETKAAQASAHSSSLPRPTSSSSSGKSSVASSRQPLSTGGGDGGNIEPGFEAEGGWGRDEAVSLLRRFYVQENGRGKLNISTGSFTFAQTDPFSKHLCRARRKAGQQDWQPWRPEAKLGHLWSRRRRMWSPATGPATR